MQCARQCYGRYAESVEASVINVKARYDAVNPFGINRNNYEIGFGYWCAKADCRQRLDRRLKGLICEMEGQFLARSFNLTRRKSGNNA